MRHARSGIALTIAIGSVIALAACASRSAAPSTRMLTSTAPGSPSSHADLNRSVTIGALPERSSLLLHGHAPLTPLEPAMKQDLQTLARDTNADPERTIRDYAAQPAFDQAIRTAQTAQAGFADAVFHAGEHAASELRFVARPPKRLLDTLRREYPRDLRIEWGEHLVGDHDRDRFSSTVFAVVHEVADTGNVSTGIDGDGRLTVDYDGSAEPQVVADAIVAADAFRALLIGGKPPTEVRVRQVDDNAASWG